jgi:hypothetical protein
MSFKREALELEDKIESNLQTFAGLLSRQDYDWILVNDMDLEIQRLLEQFSQLISTTDDRKSSQDYSRHFADYNREYQRIKVI